MQKIDGLYRWVLWLFVGGIVSLPLLGYSQFSTQEPYVFVGSYSSKDQAGIHVYRLNSKTGELRLLHEVSGVANPSYLAIDPSNRYLYSVSEIGNFQKEKSGGVSAFSIHPDNGNLTLLNQQPTGGRGPCYVSVDRTGKWLLTANYGGGSICIHPILKDGTLGPRSDFKQHEGSSVNRQRQTAPHAHSIVLDPSNRFIYTPDLGLDKIMIYRFDASQGKFLSNQPSFAAVKPGSGPRHFTFHPNQKWAYVIQELSCDITAFRFNPQTGALDRFQTVTTLPNDFQGNNTCADIHVSSDGKFLYGSNRGHDSIVVFKIHPQEGTLQWVGHESTRGKTPRNFALSPSGHFLFAANQNTHTIVSFRIDPQTGLLEPTGHITKVRSPVCIKFADIK